MVQRRFPLAVPRLTEAVIDGRALAFASAAALVTALLFGIAPGLALRRSQPGARMPTKRRGGSPRCLASARPA